MFNWLFDRLWSRRGAGAGGEFESASMTVLKGHRYKAIVNLSGFEQMIATNDAIAEKLTGAGFKEVKVKGDGGKRPAEGVWGKADTTAPIDPHLSNVVEIA